MSSLTTSQTQQKLTNALLIGNLYKSHKIGKQLTQITALHKITLGVSIANLKVNLGILQNLQKKEAEEKKIKLLKDIFFQISEEIDKIEERKSYPLEKYFLFLSLKAELEHNEIDTSLADDLSEKKMISSTIKKLNQTIDDLNKKFNKEEKEDQKLILNILEVDEESQIKSLDNSFTGIISGCISGFEKYLTYIKTFKKSENHSPNSRLVEFFQGFRKPLNKEHITSLKGNTGSGIFKAFKDGFYGEKKSREQVRIFKSQHDMFFLYVNHGKNGLVDFVEGNKNREIIILFWDEIFKRIHENLSKKEVEEILKLKSAKDSFIPVWTPSYIKIKKQAEQEADQKLDDDICKKEVYYQNNKKIIDNFYNVVLKSVKDSFQNIRKIRSKDKQKIQKLKGDIQKEKDLVKQIYKKHKFVEKILASRV